MAQYEGFAGINYKGDNEMKSEKQKQQAAGYVNESNPAIQIFDSGATRDSDEGVHFPLTRNKTAIVSLCDVEFLQEWRWCAVVSLCDVEFLQEWRWCAVKGEGLL
jgi:hypothetical protein